MTTNSKLKAVTKSESPENLSSADLMQMTKDYSSPNYAPLEVVIEKGEGVWVWDVEGKKYLDFLSAYSAINFGHRHPRIEAAAIEQLRKVTMTSRSFYTKELALLCKEISEFSGMEMALFMNSGAEGVETAIKAARRWGYSKKNVTPDQAEIIVFDRNFHGRTTTIMSFSDSEEGKRAFGPFTPGFVMCTAGDIGSVKAAISKNTVAVLVEPIQGEGGINIPPDGYLKNLRELCTAENVLMIADEIQTGMCRTGEIFCCDYENVKPDIYILGKSLGGGIIPISAVLASAEILNLFIPGSHGSTFGGNPFAARIAREVIALINEEKPQVHTKKMGEYALNYLRALSSPKIKEVRGKGLLIGVEFHPEAGKAKHYCLELVKLGVLCKDTREQTLRLAPPLVIDQMALQFGLEQLAKAIS